ncbi:MAG TPA: hypothetical protein VMU84_13365 [Thermoanaerobaculia bacterium]|nr:hypothetical protein [Thermoanaerobaculia bacterium]
MFRRSWSATLLVILAVHLLGAMAFAAACPESCPDDATGTSCPPICALCTSCTHAMQAIVQANAGDAISIVTAPHLDPSQSAATPSQLAADIFHVPLLG